MNNQISKLLTGALITGILAGSSAFAQENTDKKSDDASAQPMSAGKDGCQGKTAKKDKNSCKGMKGKKKSKNSCNGKDGCGEKEKAEKAAASETK